MQDNIDRWCGQFVQEDGRDTKDVARREERTIGAVSVHMIDIRGRFVAPDMPGSTERNDKPGYRMFGAVLETPDNTYYIKVLGPQGTLASHEAGYKSFLESMKQQ